MKEVWRISLGLAPPTSPSPLEAQGVVNVHVRFWLEGQLHYSLQLGGLSEASRGAED